MTVAALLATAAAAMPIPQGPNAGALPAFSGHAATPQPLSAPSPPSGRARFHDGAC